MEEEIMQTTSIQQPDKKANKALAVMGERLNIDPNKLLETLKKTVFKEAKTDEEIIALVIVSNEYGLNPLTRQIYAFPSKGGIVPVISIDGWIHLCNSHPKFDGVEFEEINDQNGNPTSCTAIIHRKDRKHPHKITEYYKACNRDTEPWKRFPHRMLRHKALIQCARIAFGFSGITDEEEAREIALNSSPEPQRKYPITSPKFEQLPEKKAELFATGKQPVIETELELLGGNK